MRNVARSFKMDGKRYYVPVDSMWAWREDEEGLTADANGRQRWADLRGTIESLWRPHPAFRTFADGGHVAALRPHVGKQWFAVIDLEGFYDHVTRTKVCRALEAIGLPRAAAYRLAGNSTIRQGDRYCLVRGFRQSAMLAALVLDRSLFGSSLWRQSYSADITVFSDDIILSSDDKDALDRDFYHAVRMLERSNFKVNPSKTQAPSPKATVFNIHLSREGLRLTDERMWRFLRQAIESLKGTPERNRAHLHRYLYGNYVASIDPAQAKMLEESLGISSY